MPERPLTRGEIAELADRLRVLLEMVDNGEMSASTAMSYRMQGAVTALNAPAGEPMSLFEDIAGDG